MKLIIALAAALTISTSALAQSSNMKLEPNKELFTLFQNPYWDIATYKKAFCMFRSAFLDAADKNEIKYDVGDLDLEGWQREEFGVMLKATRITVVGELPSMEESLLCEG